MGYRKYAKDYEIEYVSVPGKKREKSVRIYVGPYFRFTAQPEQIRSVKWIYLIGLVVLAALLLVPMCVDGVFARLVYVQVPVVAAWIPWFLAACSTWRLWTAGERVDREHYDLLHDRMSGACLFLMGLCSISAVGCILALVDRTPAGTDWLVCVSCLAASAVSVLLFSRRKALEMEQVENPEKPQAGKHRQSPQEEA